MIPLGVLASRRPAAAGTPPTHVGSSIITSSWGSLPAYQAGDLLIVTAYATLGKVPSLPGGWTSLQTDPGGLYIGARVGWRVAPGNGTASGTWTNATHLVTSVYRGASTPGSSAVASTEATTPHAVPALTLTKTDGSSSVLVHWANCSSSIGDRRLYFGPSGMTRTAGTGEQGIGAWNLAATATFTARTIDSDASDGVAFSIEIPGV